MNAYVASESGDFISQRHARIAEIIRDYDSTLEVQWIPPRALQPSDKMFRIICNPAVGKSYVVLHADDLDERVLTEIFNADNKNDDVLVRLDAHNTAVKAIELKKKMEEAEARQDLIAHIWKSPLHTYKHNGVSYS